jgi:hypothetical protein
MSAGDLIALKRAYALVCPLLCQGAAQGPQGPQGPPGDLSTNPVGSYYSDQSQPIATGTLAAPTIWTLNQTVLERNISVVSGTKITVAQSGIYEVYYSAQIHRTSGGSPVYIYIWLKKNGNDEPQTNGRVSVNSNNGDTLPIVPYIIQLNAGDFVEFASKASDINCQISAYTSPSIPFPAGYGPNIPSLIVGIKRVG